MNLPERENSHGWVWLSWALFRLVLITACLLSNVSRATEIFFDAQGKNAFIELPSEICDITETLEGEIITSYLSERSTAANVAIPELQRVLANCQGPFEGYPWGWLGVEQEDVTGLTQSVYNKLMKQRLGSMLDEISAQIDSKDAVDNFEQSSGLRIEELKHGKPLIIESSRNAFVFAVSQSSILNGEEWTEVILTSAMVRNGRLIYAYMYEVEENGTSILKLADDLKKMSKTLQVR